MTPEEKQDCLKMDAQLADVAYDYAWRSVGRSTEYFARIDGKATALTGIVGVILTILVSSAGVAFPQQKWSPGLAGIAQVAYSLSLISFVISLSCGIVALSLRDIKDIPSVRSVLSNYKSSRRRPYDDIRLKKSLLQRLGNVDYSYCFQVSRKILAIRKSTFFLTWGLIFLAAWILCTLTNITINSYARSESRRTAISTNESIQRN
jgi:hypothetical protein